MVGHGEDGLRSDDDLPGHDGGRDDVAVERGDEGRGFVDVLPKINLLAAGRAGRVHEGGAVGRADPGEDLTLLDVDAVGDVDGVDPSGDGRRDGEAMLGFNNGAFPQRDAERAALNLEVIVGGLIRVRFMDEPGGEAEAEKDDSSEGGVLPLLR